MKKYRNLLLVFIAILLGTQMDVQAADMGKSFCREEVSANSAPAAVQPPKVEHNYSIYVNLAWNCITIYDTDVSGNQVPVKAFVCSTGRYAGYTPQGTFQTSNYYDWQLMFGNCYTRYAVRFGKHLLLHSVPYNTRRVDDLNYRQFNKLGEPASSGCVRLSVADSKWIYDNTRPGTPVVIYSDPESPGPLGKPEPVRTDVNSPYRGWDPTDIDPNNPWRTVYDFSPEYLAFDEIAYADTYPDVKAVFGYDKQLLWKHYQKHGIKEGRTAVFRN